MIIKPKVTTLYPLRRLILSTSVNGLIGNYPGRIEEVTHSAVIRGNKRSPNAWSYRVETTSPFYGKARDTQGNYGGGYQNPEYSEFATPLQGLSQTVPANASGATIAYNTALGNLNSRVRGGLDLSVAMAEASSTFRMIKNLSKVKRYFAGIGSKRWANEWLELRYGWMPLLSDVYSSADEIQRVNLGLMFFKGRGSNSSSVAIKRSMTGVDVSGVSNYCDYPIGVTGTSKSYNACELKVLMKPPTNLTAAARWTSLNPLSIAWELVPYSFVFDWFYDVGSYMRDLETSIIYSSTFLSGYRSDLFVGETNERALLTKRGTSYFTSVTSLDAKASSSLKTFSRTLLYSYPSPMRPVVNTDLGAVRLLSAAALLRQFLK